MLSIFDNLVIFEMANNHMGDMNHAIKIIDEYSKFIKKYKEFKFCIKFQMRDLDTLIHKNHKVNSINKSIQRFTSTKLSVDNFLLLKNYSKEKGFITSCTAFDEISLKHVIDIDFDIIKVASCSNDDWPLLNEIVKYDKPIIISLGSLPIESVDNTVSFLSNRNKKFAIMHCVAEYPTTPINLQLNQINFLKNRYNIPTGFSTHEPTNDVDAIKIAIAKGASIFEKHIALKTDKYIPNLYSCVPEEIEKWLDSALTSLVYCGLVNQRYIPNKKELEDLNQFKRGAFLKRDIKVGENITRNDVYYAIPNDYDNRQLSVSHFSKYSIIKSKFDILKDNPIYEYQVDYENVKNKMLVISKEIKNFIKNKNILLTNKNWLEISMHYGLDKFFEYGCGIFTLINRDYCKKYIILLPNQIHPEQYHKQKEETFIILDGELDLKINNKYCKLKKSECITINRGDKHEMTTTTGCIIEEISTTHISNDSFYTDDYINNNSNRKFIINYWEKNNE